MIRHVTFGYLISMMSSCYRPDDQTNSVKALKETNWSSQIRLESHQNDSTMLQNTTLGKRLYAQRTHSKGPNVTNPICLTCKTAHISVLQTVKTVLQSSTELF